MKEDSLEGFYSVREAADFLEITPTAVYRLVGRGKLGTVYRGGVHFIRKQAVRNLLADKQYQEMSRRGKGVKKGSQLDLEGLNDGA